MRLAITELEAMPVDQGVQVSVGDHRIAMFRIGDEVLAIGDTCSHAEASLSEGEVFDGSVECPRHGSEFDLRTGKPMSLPATQPVPTYRVLVEDGTVYLDLDEDE